MKEQIHAGYARVTEILSPYQDFSKVHPAVLEAACSRGSKVHDYCEAYSLGLLIEEPEEDCKPYVNSFIEWFDKYVEEVINVEERLYSQEYKITGKYDLLCKLKGSDDLVLIDYKTPSTESRTWALQTAAYQLMYNRTHSAQVDRRVVLMLNKQGSPAKVIEYTNHEKDKILFLSALNLYRFFNS